MLCYLILWYHTLNHIQVMGAENFDRSQAASMLQKMATTVPGGAAVLAAFLQDARDDAPNDATTKSRVHHVYLRHTY